MNDKRFYVYEWYDVDSGEVFYVGKGTGNRYRAVNGRNKYFSNYYNKHNCAVRKIKENLLENDAFDMEVNTISKYRSIGQCKCNLSDGGEGCTFAKGSWNDIYRKLSFMSNMYGKMDDMPNENKYDNDSLKNSTIEELIMLYEEYKDFTFGNKTAYELGLIKELDGYELKVANQEIEMLTQFLICNIAKNNEEFKDVLTCKNRIDFICLDININCLLDELFSYNNYYLELSNAVLYVLRFMKSLNRRQDVSVPLNVKSFNIVGRNLNIKFNTDKDRSNKRIIIDLYDVAWTLFVEKNTALYCQLYSHIQSAEIIQRDKEEV